MSNVRKSLFKLSARLQRLITPGLRYSQSVYEDVLAEQVPDQARWLDVGCGHALLPEWREKSEQALVSRASTLVGIDYDLDALRKHRSIRHRSRADATHLPFSDGAFDVVTANMVVEHLEDPARSFGEIGRLLKSGGLFIFHTPNAWGYPTMLGRSLPFGVKRRLAYLLDGREEEDVYPTHYRANTVDAVRDVARASGFDAERLDLIVTSPLLQMIPPLLVFELVWIRFLMTPAAPRLRSNLIAILRKR